MHVPGGRVSKLESVPAGKHGLSPALDPSQGEFGQCGLSQGCLLPEAGLGGGGAGGGGCVFIPHPLSQADYIQMGVGMCPMEF